MTPIEKQQLIDDEHLRLLRLGYFISAGVNLFMSIMGVVYAVMGSIFLHLPRPAAASNPNGMPAEVGWMFVVMGIAITTLMTSLATAKLHVAKCLKQRRGLVFCMVVAAICCVGIPYGTALSVFTFLVLGRPSVADAFRQAPPRLTVGGSFEHGA